MDDINKIILNRITDGKYTENDILNLAIKIYDFINEQPTARYLAVTLWRYDFKVKYCTSLCELMSCENQVEAIRYIVELMTRNLDGLDDIYLYQPVRVTSNFNIDFLELQVLIEWSCYCGKSEKEEE